MQRELLFTHLSNDFLPLARTFLQHSEHIEAMTLLATPEDNTLWKEVELPHENPFDGLPTLTSAFFYYAEGLIYVEADAREKCLSISLPFFACEHSIYTRKGFGIWQDIMS